jgi:hypothetical protein
MGRPYWKGSGSKVVFPPLRTFTVSLPDGGLYASAQPQETVWPKTVS